MRASSPGYARYAWGTLSFTVLVILWGAYVRASGSGAGCGSHWPLCNGEVLPRSPATATLIEFGHRLTSGAALLLVVGLVICARRMLSPGSAGRRAAWLSLLFMVTEALIGAGLVLFEYVAEDASLARGVWMSAHLVNTFLLVAALTLCAVWASGVGAPSWAGRSTLASVLGLALLAVLVLGMSGAVTALGDTLFPAATLAEAKALTWSEGAHLFVRLRIWHPGLAVFAGVLLTAAVMLALSQRATQGVRKAARALLALYLLQLGVGLLDVWLLAPIAMQIIHLLLADLVWIALVTLTATSLEEEAVVDAPALARAAASSRA